MRGFGRWLGYLLLALTVAALANDGLAALRTGTFHASSVGELWALVHRAGLGTIESLSPWLTQNVLAEVLNWRAWAAFGLPGLALAIACRPRNNNNHRRRRRARSF